MPVGDEKDEKVWIWKSELIHLKEAVDALIAGVEVDARIIGNRLDEILETHVKTPAGTATPPKGYSSQELARARRSIPDIPSRSGKTFPGPYQPPTVPDVKRQKK